MKLFYKIIFKLRNFYYKGLSNYNIVSGKPILNQPVLFIGKGRIQIDENVNFGYFPSPYFYNTLSHIEARQDTAIIRFKKGIVMNNNFTAIAEKSSITIGENVLIGSNVQIVDSDFHEIDPKRRNSGNHKCKPVVIEDNVFIGNNVIILKGVTIGENSIISAGAIVYESFPENVIIAGNPAKIVKQIYI